MSDPLCSVRIETAGLDTLVYLNGKPVMRCLSVQVEVRPMRPPRVVFEVEPDDLRFEGDAIVEGA